jgi:carboxylate-amine ligase
MGVEEEYLVADPATREVVPEAARALARTGQPVEVISKEVTKFQLEGRTQPQEKADDLLAELRRVRRVAASAATAEELLLLATGAPVLGPREPPPLLEGERYELGERVYGALNDEQTICALHVHVEMPDRERALLVGNHLRPWLPLLISLTANSPFWLGRDTGHASWRTLAWGRWPVAGPPPYFGCLDDYERLVATLMDAGVLVDQGTIFWDVRPSVRFPTVEVRVMDVPLSVDDSALTAMIVRGLAGTALAAVEAGDPGPRLPAELLRAAYWRAARHGLDGPALDPRTGKLISITELLARLIEHAGDALEEYGDIEAVTRGLACLDERGNGAAAQRSAHRRRGSLTDVVDRIAVGTRSGELLGEEGP